MTIIFRLLLLILLFLSVFGDHVQAVSSRNIEEREKLKSEKKNSETNKILKVSTSKKMISIGVLEDQSSLEKKDRRSEKEKKIFKNLKEAEEYLKCLKKERKVLVKDFWGLNITAYRYVNIFYRRGYIRYRISTIDEEIKKTKSEINKLRKNKLIKFKIN